jgi:hypothetical protein
VRDLLASAPQREMVLWRGGIGRPKPIGLVVEGITAIDGEVSFVNQVADLLWQVEECRGRHFGASESRRIAPSGGLVRARLQVV